MRDLCRGLIEAFGYDNMSFLKGYIEKLDELDLKVESFDVIVSNTLTIIVHRP